MAQTTSQEEVGADLDVLVVGAGFSGLYLLYRLHGMGLRVRAIEEAPGVGGTWYWNRYPGARCDIPTTDYTYSFDPALEEDWQWSEKYATQPEILAYLDHVADRYNLRDLIQLSTRVEQARWDDPAGCWRVRNDRGEELSSRFLVLATGCLSLPKTPDIDGADRFDGEVYFTARWPHDPVDFSGKRVAVIGTGSSGIQCIPIIAREARSLTVFQRTASFTVPAHNGPQPLDRLAALAEDREGYREAARLSWGGVPTEIPTVTCASASEEVRRERFEAAWDAGQLFSIGSVFADQLFDAESNGVLSEMIRGKIRSIVTDPVTAEDLCPHTYPFGTKRPCLDTEYFQTFNLPHVRLVNLRRTPITTITESGIATEEGTVEVDMIVYATGFDAVTGPLLKMDIVGRDGLRLAEKWSAGPSAYLGLATAGFPNLFTVTGPGSPSVLTNMVVSIEQHVEWIARCLGNMRSSGFTRIEPTRLAESAWNRHVQDCGNITLFPKADSWYMGANVPGKPRTLLPYAGGVGAYRTACDEVTARDYLGFSLSGPEGTRCNDGVVRPLQPDVAQILDALRSMDLPPIESMDVENARIFMEKSSADRPPGPEVGEVVDGVMTTALAQLPYRLYRPDTPGPHAVVVYFHGGGWVLGNLDSDDPLCRDLCRRSGCAFISVDYRHAPESRFPAAALDALAAIEWIDAHGKDLGLDQGRLAVAGWSSGGNLAAVACQQARDAGGPPIAGQVLLCPVTDYDPTRPSYLENGDGYVLTSAAMEWFWDHYAGGAHRHDPRVSPLRGELRGLPPAFVVTAEFDPLRDEGRAYADALAKAGVSTQHESARGHVHSSVPMVGVVGSGVPVREKMALALRRFLAVDAGPDDR